MRGIISRVVHLPCTAMITGATVVGLAFLELQVSDAAGSRSSFSFPGAHKLTITFARCPYQLFRCTFLFPFAIPLYSHQGDYPLLVRVLFSFPRIRGSSSRSAPVSPALACAFPYRDSCLPLSFVLCLRCPMRWMLLSLSERLQRKLYTRKQQPVRVPGVHASRSPSAGAALRTSDKQ